jgi:4-amino-4-deoxy-L-arabinose transferase-like glycosyltransferase
MRAILIVLLSSGVILAAGFHLAFLTRYPVVFIDEPWYANAQWSWLRAGTSFNSMNFDWPCLGNLPWVASFAMFGLGLFQARLVSWCFGLLLLLATVWVGRRSYGLLTGGLAALLLSLSPAYTQASHYVRPDIMLAVVVMVAFGLAHKALTEERWWTHLLAGLLLGVALDIHQNAALFGLGLVAMYWVTYRRHMFRRRGTWLCAVGGLLGIGYYLAVHVLPNPEGYALFMRFSLSTTNQPPIRTLSLMSWIAAAAHEVGRYHFFQNSLDFALIGAGIAYLSARRSRNDRLLVVFVAVTFVAFVLFIGNKDDIYAVLFYPFLMLMVAETLVALIRSECGLDPRRVFAGSLLLMLLVSSGIRFARPLVQNRGYDYCAVTERIRSVTPPGARVMGLPFWWLGLADYDYRSSMNLTYYHYLNGYSLTEGLQVIRPDVIIIDDLLRGMLGDRDGFPPGPGFSVYDLPGREFWRFMSQHGRKLLEFTDPWHGRLEIYAVDWE